MKTASLKQFRILYNELDQALAEKSKLPKRAPFVQKLKKFIKRYPSFEERKEDIRNIHELRNILIHEEKHPEDTLVPTTTYLNRIENLIKAIRKPQIAIDIASKNIFGCGLNDKILDIIHVMADKIYSQVPVFENKDERIGFKGIISESIVTSLLGGTKTKFVTEKLCINKNAKVSDIENLVKKPIKDCWAFIPKNMDAYKVRQMFQIVTFDNAKQVRARLGVLFVTKTGRKDEKIEGIITAWDLSKIK
jgi:CBS domain-containing protein